MRQSIIMEEIDACDMTGYPIGKTYINIDTLNSVTLQDDGNYRLYLNNNQCYQISKDEFNRLNDIDSGVIKLNNI